MSGMLSRSGIGNNKIVTFHDGITDVVQRNIGASS